MYLEDKNVKFEDKRLECCINTASFSSIARKKIDLLVDNLTDEAIEAINSCEYIYGIPMKDGSTMETFISDSGDPSFNSSVRFISIIKDDVSYNYCFDLSYFHSKTFGSNTIFFYGESLLSYDKDGEYKEEKSLKNKNLEFTIYTKEDTSMFNREGIYASKNYKNILNGRDYFDVDELLYKFRILLKDRKEYVSQDKEVYRRYYNKKYEYYTSEENQTFSKLFERSKEMLDILYCLNYQWEFLDDDMEIEVLKDFNPGNNEVINNIDKPFVSYEEWADKNNIEMFDPVKYNDWVKNKVNKTRNDDNEVKIYEVYNPNRYRYEDEEEVKISKGRR